MLRICIFIMLVLGMIPARAVDFSKSSYTLATISGSTAKFAIAPSPAGTFSVINSGWAVKSADTLGVLLNKPISATTAAGITPFEQLLGNPSKLEASLKVSPKSLAKSLVNPWSFAASFALQGVLGTLASEACIRIAGGQMVNTNGLWEECKQVSELVTVYSCKHNVTNQLFKTGSAQSSSELCFPPGTKVGNLTYTGFHSLIRNNCGTNCHSALFTYVDNVGFTDRQSVVMLYESKEMMEGMKWESTSPDRAEIKITEQLTKAPSQSISVFEDLYNNNITLPDVSNVTVTGPQSVPAGDPVTMVKTNPDGTTESSQQQFVKNYSYLGDTVTHISTTTTNVVNNNNSQTTTSTTYSSETNLTTCGVPGSAPCKMDESGTPTPDSAPDTTSVFAAIKTCLENPEGCLPAFPQLSWAFTLPSNCAPIPVNGFESYISSIDICPYQSIFHDLMSLIWAATGLFAASGMLFRDSQGA
jgi:hypothetical protein